MNTNIIHMAAMSSAIRKLLSGKPNTKPETLLIAAAQEPTQAIIAQMLSIAKTGGTTFLALFSVEDDAVLLDRIMIVDGTTNPQIIQVGCGNFIEKADGTYAIASLSVEDGYEYVFNRGGRELKRRTVVHASDRALMEMRGIQALITKAASVACQAEAATAACFDS